MTKKLDDAIAIVRQLPPEEQDELAGILFASLPGGPEHGLTETQQAEVRLRVEASEGGRARLATDQDMAAFWKSLGV